MDPQALRDKIEAFRLECAEAEYTDTDEAWHLLSEISQALREIAQSTEDEGNHPDGLVYAGDFDITDGQYYAASVGEFVGMLVDLGDDAIIFRRVQDYPSVEPDCPNAFVRQWEIWSVPDGMIRRTMRWVKCEYVHRVLGEMLKREVVK